MGQIDGDGRLADPSLLIDQADDHECIRSFTCIFDGIRLLSVLTLRLCFFAQVTQ
jgi:hypothetical protein